MSVSWTAPAGRAGDWIAVFRVGGSYEDDWYGLYERCDVRHAHSHCADAAGAIRVPLPVGRRFSRGRAQQPSDGPMSPVSCHGKVIAMPRSSIYSHHSGVSMPTLPDLLYVALFAVALPLWDNLVFWPAFHRQAQANPARARASLYAWGIASPWALVAVGTALWMSADRSWTSFGFSVPDGWRLWTSSALFLLLAVYHAYAVATVARSSDAQASIRRQFEQYSLSSRTLGQSYACGAEYR